LLSFFGLVLHQNAMHSHTGLIKAEKSESKMFSYDTTRLDKVEQLRKV